MKFRLVNRPTTYLSILLGSAFFPGTVPAATVDALAVQAPSAAAPALMLAKLWQVGQDPGGFLVSEKLASHAT